MSEIAFVTCAQWPDGTPGDRLLQPALHSLGLASRFVPWDDGTVDWRSFDAVVLRSTWDYHLRLHEFENWLRGLDEVGANVWNSIDTLRWNANKRYLLELAGKGIPTVPTVLLTRDRAIDLGHIMQQHGWRKAVVKPAVSADAHDTWICDLATVERDKARVMRMLGTCDVLVQPLMQEVIREGEYSLVFFAGHYSHALLKKPKAGDFRTQTGEETAISVDDETIGQAARVLAVAPHPTLYARIDGVLQNGAFVLMELELIEPALWLASNPQAADRFAAAISAVARRGTRLLPKSSGGVHGVLPRTV